MCFFPTLFLEFPVFVKCPPNFGQKFGGVSLLKYTFGIKLNTVFMVLRDHMSLHEVSRITGICRTLIREWVNLYKNHGIKDLERHRSYIYITTTTSKVQVLCKFILFVFSFI